MTSSIGKCFIIFLTATTLFLLGGCGLSSRPYPLVRTFTLDVPLGEDAAIELGNKKPKATVMLITSPPPAAYEGKKMVFKTATRELNADFYNEYYSPPTRAIADSFAKYLDYSNKDYHFVRSQGVNTPEFVLELALLDFYGDSSQGPESLEAKIALTLTLNDLRGRNPKLLFIRNYSKSVSATRTGEQTKAEALADAMVRGLTDIVNSLESDLYSSLSSTR
jgi:cholesterol transport system auxiliary component